MQALNCASGGMLNTQESVLLFEVSLSKFTFTCYVSVKMKKSSSAISVLIFPNMKSRLSSIASLSEALVMDPYSLNPTLPSYRLSFGRLNILLITSRVNWYQKLDCAC